MSVDLIGLLVLACFYILIFIVGVLAARKYGKPVDGTSLLESSVIANRNISGLVGVFTMTATTVGGGYINGTAESIVTSGLVWTQAPFGIFIGLSLGGLIYARPMRDKCYLTMLDPLYEQYGPVLVVMVYCASLCGDLFWTASILLALGTSLSVILNIGLTVAIVTSAAVTVLYTMVGLMISVAYTDVVQLCLISFGLVFSVPFVLTNEKVDRIDPESSGWLGQLESPYIGQWVDLCIVMTLGTIPWQAYFQRVLSVKDARQAQILSIVGGFLALILVVPSVLIGTAGKSAEDHGKSDQHHGKIMEISWNFVEEDWNATEYGRCPLNSTDASMILPLVLHEFTPRTVAVIGLGAISAAVMSSMDSAVLASSSMFTCNIYKQIFRKKASQQELLWIQRLAVFLVGSMATVIAMFVPVIYGLFILAADIVCVIVLPQLTCALFFKSTNTYGAITGYIVGLLLRVGAGEGYLNLPPLIRFPMFEENVGQVFPFRTFSMCVSFLTIISISLFAKYLFSKHILPESFDICHILHCSQPVLTGVQNYSVPGEQYKHVNGHMKSCDQDVDLNNLDGKR